ncbi:MAG: glycosyltransferase [Clostridia bacterium]|nr:glycosyltransferase [Clostridia bacterium]
MKVLMLSTVHGVHDHRIYYKEAVSLSKEHNVTVIAIDKSCNCGDVDNNCVLIRGFDGKISMKDHIPNCVMALASSLCYSTDVIHCHEPSSLFIGCIHKFLWGSKLVYDRHEYYQRLIGEKVKRLFKNNFMTKLAEKVESIAEKVMMVYADRIIVVDAEMSEQVRNDAIIHNYPEGLTWKLREGTNFGYVGIINHRKIPESVKIINELSKHIPEIKYKIAGMAFDRSDLPEDNNNVHYHGVIPHNTIQEFLADTSFGFCLYDKKPRYETARSTKTFEYIMSGIPVIASRTAGNQFIENNGYGILIDPDNIGESVKAILEAIPKCAEYSLNCKKAKFGWEEEKLLKLYEGLE